ncbi:MAG: ACP S-malonyltransferase, partial [Kiritimatiellae bacterium]|nr:ACP S-malonyltransferase [Kiritimatiellia bacterium]
FMAPAAEKLSPVLAAVPFREPAVPVLSNYTGRPHGGADEIRASMLAQIANPVRWTDDMAALAAAGATRFYEFGPGAVLTGLAKRAVPGATLFNVSSEASARAAAAS